jgi:transposase
MFFCLNISICNRAIVSIYRQKHYQLKKKVLELEKALEYEKLRTEALDMMIDIAENQEGISIRKKSGAKRL